MANVPYNEGVPDTAPETRAPDDYQRLNVDPNAFGGAIAQGEQQLGAGASKLNEFYTQSARDDQLNKTYSKATKLLTGDASRPMVGPNGQPVLGPDGKQVADTGYFGLQGADAMTQRSSIEAALDKVVADGRANLSSPQSLVDYDNASRRMRAQWAEQIGRHADAQAKTWMGGVSNDKATQAINAISSAPDDLQTITSHAPAYIDARVEQAQQKYGVNLTPVIYQATVDGAKRDLLRARVEAISANDPARAKDLLDKNQTLAGPLYEPLSQQLRGRADQANGQNFVLGGSGQAGAITKAHAAAGYANPALPVFSQVAAGGGMSAAGAARTVQIESSGNPNAGAGTSHQGLVQADIKPGGYWSKYGQGSPLDPTQSILALGRSTAHDRPILAQALGRNPTDAELYLAHQQGLGGATALLAHPNMPAADVLAPLYHGNRAVAASAIKGNGGDPNAPASAFTNMWTAKFGGNGVPTFVPGGGQTMTMPASVSGAAPAPTPDAPVPDLPTFAATPTAAGIDQTPPAAPTVQAAPPVPARQVDNIPSPTDVRADIFAQINAAEELGRTNPGAPGSLTYGAAQHARSVATQHLQSQAIAQEQDVRAQKAASDNAANGYVTRMLKGDFANLPEQIANDPHLTWETKRTLGEAVEKEASDGSRETVKHYGQGFFPALKAVTASAGDPTRINDPTSLLSRVGPNGDLTLTGYEKLVSLAKQSAKDVNGASENRLRTHAYEYANEKLTYTIPSFSPYQPDKKDVKGTELFNSVFIPQVEAASEKWVASGHSLSEPNSPISKKNIDALIETIRPKRQMDAERISAGQGLANEAPAAPFEPPPPPASVADPNAWKTVVSTPVHTNDGKALPQAEWAKAVSMLASKPTPDMVRFFNNSRFGQAGLDGDKVLTFLGVQHLSPTGGAKLAATPSEAK